MVIHIEATYENGILRPSEPLDLPNQTPVHLTVVSEESFQDENSLSLIDESLPEGPMITVEDFRRIMEQNTLRARSLPIDFDRDDIYADHD